MRIANLITLHIYRLFVDVSRTKPLSNSSTNKRIGVVIVICAARL